MVKAVTPENWESRKVIWNPFLCQLSLSLSDKVILRCAVHVSLVWPFRLSRVAEETIRDYFETHLALLEPVFPIACHRLCEGPDFSTDFNYKPPQNVPEGRRAVVVVGVLFGFGKKGGTVCYKTALQVCLKVSVL